MSSLDATDRKILNLLQSNGRMTNAEVAERVHLSPSATLRRVKRLEEDGVIEAYVALVSPAAIGRSTNVFVEITLNSQSEECIDTFEAAVREAPDIMECYLMSGDFDYLLRVVAADTADFERIHRTCLTRLPGLARTRSGFVMRTVGKKPHFDLT
jgi:Lrp/AsnC family leucine-responsive transcriptional regulator